MLAVRCTKCKEIKMKKQYFLEIKLNNKRVSLNPTNALNACLPVTKIPTMLILNVYAHAP